jgi:GT2 family glycosyltransferase
VTVSSAPSTSSRPDPNAEPAGPSPLADITVVVISRNRRADLLASLAHHEAPVVLVDNASTDGSVEAVRAAYPEVTVLPQPRNLGAVGRTIGVARAGTPFVAFADDDSWWAPGDLARAVEIMRAHPRLAVLNARVLVGPEERLDPICTELAASPLGTPPDLPGPALLGFIACGVMVRSEAFLAAGGFDPVIRFPGEEERLAFDLAAAGWGIAYVDSVTVHHHPSPARQAPAQRQAAVWRSRVLTAVMRLPWAEVAGTTRRAMRAGPMGRAGLRASVRDVAAAVRCRRVLPARVLADLRRIGAGADADEKGNP